jgi:hypothetical protein
MSKPLSPTKTAILEALYDAPGPLDALQIHYRIKIAICSATIEADLWEMATAGQVQHYNVSFKPPPYDVFTITERGRACLIGDEARNIFSPSAEELKTMAEAADPIQVTMCNASEPREPLTARLIVDEDELDLWWANLGVEEKADAFAGLSLRMHGGESCVYVEAGIPVEGAIGVGPKHPTQSAGKAVQG